MQSRSLVANPGFLRTLVLSFGVLLASQTARAEFGLRGLLDPEGSNLFPNAVVAPRHPGKPDPRWTSFDWHFIDQQQGVSPMRIYFYTDEEWAARLAVPKIRTQVSDLIGTLGFAPRKQFSYALFTSHRQFRQANLFFISEGVQGITSTQEASMAVPYWGDPRAFDHVSKHEMVHQFQTQRIDDLSVIGGAAEDFPLWFIEGMAEYFSIGEVDRESSYYLRDVMLYPDPHRKYTPPGFFEEGVPGFVNTYKMGQAKLDFLQTSFGPATARKILDTVATNARKESPPFQAQVGALVGKTPDAIEKMWKEWLEANYRPKLAGDPWKDLSPLEDATDRMDSYEISPDGRFALIRLVDELTGVTSIQLHDLKAPPGIKSSVVLTHDGQPETSGLFFMELPTLALSEHWAIYATDTGSGPEIEFRRFELQPNGEFKVEKPFRLRTHDYGLLEVSSIAISPDERSIAFVGQDHSGWTDIHVIDGFLSERKGELRSLTHDYFDEREIQWTADDRIVFASNRTPDANYALYSMSAHRGGAPSRLTSSADDLGFPDVENGEMVFQSWESGSSQIHLIKDGHETRLTNVPTWLSQPRLRGDTLYAVGFKSGRFRLFTSPRSSWGRFAPRTLVESDKETPPPNAAPWVPELADFSKEKIQKYKPFISSGIRIDSLSAFIGGGFYGASLITSDLMHNYSISADLSFVGDAKHSTGSIFLTSNEGRSTWTVGPYRTLQTRLDPDFSNDSVVRTYFHNEYGALVNWEYPMTVSSFFSAQMRMGAVKRTDFSEPSLDAEWNATNPGTELLLGPTLRMGYDTVLYEAFTGPLDGYSALIEADTTYYPRRNSASERLRLDVGYYKQIWGSSLFAMQALAGSSFGGQFRNSFFVLSDDILRAYPFPDDRLYGTLLAAAKFELRFPIGTLFGFPPFRGLAAYDIGSVFTHVGDFAERLSSSIGAGFVINLPPLSIAFIGAHPTREAPGPHHGVVGHFLLRYLYL